LAIRDISILVRTELWAQIQVRQMKRPLSIVASLAAALITTACGFEHTTSVLVPTSLPTATSSTPSAGNGAGNGPGVSTPSTPSLVGTWASASAAPTLPDPSTCGNFTYQIASQTSSSISGTFTAVCGGGLAIAGSVSGTLNGTAVSITVSGTANMPGIPNCAFTLSGTGAIEDNGNTLRVPFSGTTCLGPVNGTEVLRRPQSEPVATIAEPASVSPSPNLILSGVRTTFVVANASHSGSVGPLVYTFEVATDEGFAHRFGSWNVPEGPNQTSLELPQDFSYTSVYYWHVRAFDGATTSPWSRTLALATPNPPAAAPAPAPAADPTVGCDTRDKERFVDCVHGHINPSRTVEGGFEVTKWVAWGLRGEGAGLLIKNGGENIIGWQGYSFAAGRICYPNGQIYKVLTDVPSTNGPSWQDNGFVDRGLYVPAINPR
jgi:hypothetical protein